MKKSLLDFSIRFQVLLEGYKTSKANELAKSADAMFLATMETLAGFEGTLVNQTSAKSMKSALKGLRLINSSIVSDATEKMMADLEGLAGWGANYEVRSFGNLSHKVAMDGPTMADAYQFALNKPMSVNGDSLQSFLTGWGGGEVDRVNQTVQMAWSEGWTVNRLTQVIGGTASKNYTDALIGVVGSTASSYRRNARAVARTSAQHVAQSARMKTWEDNKDVVVGYEWVSTLDSRTTAICRSLDGKVYEVGAGPVPPKHINCRSTTVAKVDPAFDFLDEGATRSSNDGYVDANLSYYDWLKTQPAEFQDHAIGPTRGLLFRNGGLSNDDFAALNLGRDFKPLTLSEMEKLEPLAFQKAGIDPSTLPKPRNP